MRPRLLTVGWFGIVLLGLAAAGPAVAQDGGASQPDDGALEIIIDPAPGVDRADILERSERPRETDVVAPVTQADLNALVYYAQTGQFDKLDLEIRRLQRQNPGWEVPDDLFRQGPVVEEQEVWDLYSRGQFAQARSVIARKQARNPGWQPSEDLLEALELGEQRKLLQAAAEVGQWETVAAIVDRHPELVSCTTVDALWLAAEAQARLDRPARAAETYGTAIADCESFRIRSATLEKAAERLDAGRLERLFAQEADRSHSTEEAEQLARLRERLLRGKVARALETNATAELSPDAVADMEAAARSSRDAETATLLAWYHLRRDRPDSAEDWFRRALEWGGETADARQGLILSLKARGRLAEAERMAWEHKEASAELRALYGSVAQTLLAAEPPATVDAERLDRITGFAEDRQNGPLAADLGWYFQRRGQREPAQTWFERSLAWKPSEKAAEGLALLYQATGQDQKLDALFERWAGRSKALAKLKADFEGGGPPSPIVQALQSERYGTCLRLARGEERKEGGATPDLLVIKGWCLLNLDRPTEAGQAFAAAAELAETEDADLHKDAALGRIFTLEARGLHGEAYDLAVASDLDPADQDALRGRVLARLAQQAYDEKAYRQAIRMIDARARYGPPERGLLMLKGWAHFQIHETLEALNIFRALDEVLSTPETREAIKITYKEMYRQW